MNFSSIYTNLILSIPFFSGCILLISFYEKILSSFVSVIIYCVGAGIATLVSIFDGTDSYLFRRKMEKTRSVKEEMDGRVFISRKSRHFSLYK